MRSLPFEGSTTAAEDYRAYPLERRPAPEVQEYRPNNAKFYAETTANESYKAWDVPKRERAAAPAPAVRSLPFEGSTTAAEDYKHVVAALTLPLPAPGSDSSHDSPPGPTRLSRGSHQHRFAHLRELLSRFCFEN